MNTTIDRSENSIDTKIMNWDMFDFDLLVDSFTDNELKDMVWWLTDDETLGCISEDYLINPNGILNRSTIVYEYMCRWLFQKIDQGETEDLRELFDRVMAVRMV